MKRMKRMIRTFIGENILLKILNGDFEGIITAERTVRNEESSDYDFFAGDGF
jgi:hypothetical protein